MASAVELLSGEKKRLPVRFRNWPYNSAAKALLPSTAAARSAVADAGDCAAVAAACKPRQAMSDESRGFMPISIKPGAAGADDRFCPVRAAASYRLYHRPFPFRAR